MAARSWHLDRRTFLRGTGLSLAVPWLEAMAKADPAAAQPKRFCAFFVGNGVAIPKEDSTESKEGWSWFPKTTGRDYTLTKPLEPLAPHRSDMSIFGGMSHPSSRLLVGHATVDVWLTGADIRVSLQNSISLDQLIARHLGQHTRIPSLVLSSHGGVGTRSRSTTISFDAQGRSIPAESTRRVFERLFEPPANGDRAAREQVIASGRRRVDFLLEDSRSLRNKLGSSDQHRLDEFLESLNEVESRLSRAQDWLGRALPQVDRESINLDVSPTGPTDYIRTMFNLIVLAFQTDTTRVAAYQICAEDGVGICDRFPTILGIGRRGGHHRLSHSDGRIEWSQYDRYLTEQFAYFLDRLTSIREADSRLLDNTMALFGSGTSTTHNARNYPIILAGGSNLGVRDGRFFNHQTERPLGDLYVTMLQRYGISVDSFAENAGQFSEILADN